MSVQGWIVLLVVAGAAFGLAYKLIPKATAKGQDGCCGGGDSCPSKRKKP